MSEGIMDTYEHSNAHRENDRFISNQEIIKIIRERINSFIEEKVTRSDANGVVVAMSGGIDSTLTAMLATEALGSDRVLGLTLPCNKIDQRHTNEARTIAEGLGIDFREISLYPFLQLFRERVAPEISSTTDKQSIGNVIARLRMVCAYYAANTQSRLVLGTANRSELLLGYFTKYGDGAADLYPIGNLYKTEVRSLAQHVGVPKRIINKDSTAGFWAGQTDEDELGVPYDVIDPLLVRVVEQNRSVDATAEKLDIDDDIAEAIAERYAATVHKRNVPPTP